MFPVMRSIHLASRSTIVSILCATILLAAAGCKVGPNYTKAPAVQAPPTFSEDGHNGDWAAAKPADGTDRGAWWTVFNDPDLDRLEVACATANQSIAAALHAYEQAHDFVRENRSSLYPQVSIGGFADRNRISNTRPLRPVNAQQYYWDFLIPLNISWEPDLWGSIRRQVESSSANAQASAADLANTRLSVQGLLAVDYLQLRGIDLQAQLLRNTLDAYTQSLQLTEDRFHGGLASESDVEQSRAQLEATRAESVDLGEQRAVFEHAIAALVGVPATGYHIAERPLAGDPPSIPTGIPSQLLERRPDIAAAERRVASANAQIGVAQAAFYPQVTLGAAGGVESAIASQVFQPGSTQWNAGPGANQVIFDGGRRRAQVAYARSAREQATALYRQNVLSAFRDVEDQLAALRVLEQESSVQARAVAAARRSTELSTLRYKRGLAPYLEVLTNQTVQLSDERTAASLTARRIVASAQLGIALGGGWNTTELPKN